MTDSTDHKIVLRAGGTADQIKRYAGQPRELIADISNREIRFMDGVTEGGMRIPNIETNDSRYQKKSNELTALSNFIQTAVGFVVRTAAATYVLRKLGYDSESILITNADGKNGDPTISLAPNIESDHVFGGQIEFEQAIVATGGVEGDLTGDVEGNLNGDTTGNHVGGVDVRGHTLQLDDGQIPIAKINGLQAALDFGGVKPGMIMMWAGVTVPAGWFLCDGTNGTPDLVDKFIMGAVLDDVGETGGNVNHTHTTTSAPAGDHSHTVSVGNTTLTTTQIPAHNHGLFSSGTAANASVGASSVVARESPSIGGDTQYILRPVTGGTVDSGVTSDTGSSGSHSHSASSGTAGSHTHVMTTDAASVVPPYYALAFIMKGA